MCFLSFFLQVMITRLCLTTYIFFDTILGERIVQFFSESDLCLEWARRCVAAANVTFVNEWRLCSKFRLVVGKTRACGRDKQFNIILNPTWIILIM